MITDAARPIAEHAFLNYYGERGSRIQRDDSVLEGSIRRSRSFFFLFLSPILFFMPSVYMDELEHVWIDRTVDWITWRRFITMLTRDWENSITPVSHWIRISAPQRSSVLNSTAHYRRPSFFQRMSDFWQYKASTPTSPAEAGRR